MTSDRSGPARFLARHPEIRARVQRHPGYVTWKATLRPVVIDGVPFFFPEGDIQKEEDDLVVDFALRNGFVTLEQVERENQEEGGPT